MKLLNLSSLSIVLLILTLSGCGAKPKPKEEAVVDSTLPKVSLTKNATKSTMKSIALEWKQIKDKRVQGVYIYRESLDENLTQEDAYHDTIDNRFATHYLDTNVKPSHRYKYYFVTYSNDAQGQRSDTYQTSSKPVLDSVSWAYAANSMPRSAKIIWRPHKNGIVKGYEIHRKALDEDKWSVVARLDGRLNVEYIDKGLKDNHTYHYHVRAVTYNGVVSKPSQTVKSVTKKLPLVITNLKATNTLPKKIQLTWDRSQNKDFSYYKLYRSSKSDGGYDLLAKLKRDSYVDEIQEDGATYFYMVTAVDKDELESPPQPHATQGNTLSKPLPPAVVDAEFKNDKVFIDWRKNDQRSKSYTVVRSYKKGFFDTVVDKFKDITNNSFVDTKIEKGNTYFYHVIAVDENSIESEPSLKAVVEIPKEER